MVVGQNWFDVLISKISLSSLFTPGEHVYIELFIHIFTVEHKWFQIASRWKFITISSLCAETGAQSFLPLHATNPSPSILLFISLCVGWSLKFPTEATRAAPQPVCHYRWPVAHLYLPLISRPSWEAANSMPHREGGGSKGWGWGERWDRKGGETGGKGWRERQEGNRTG